MIPAVALTWLAGIKRWPWKLIGIVLLTLLILWLVRALGKYAYALGASDEREVWEQRISTLETRTEELGREAATNQRRVTARINDALASEREQLESMTDADDSAFLNSWASGDSRLLNSATSSGRDQRD